MPDIAIAGLEPYSSCDWPGELVATVFCQGCPWSCPYCHNDSLRPPGPGQIPWSSVRDLLERRRGLLDAIVFSGGEPTLQRGLPAALEDIRGLGLRVALHTGGAYPARLRAVLPLLDWVGFDVKAPLDSRYDTLVRAPGAVARVRESLRLLRDSGVAHDLRTTVHPSLLDSAGLAQIDDELAVLGLGPTRRQPFRAEGCKDPTLCSPPVGTDFKAQGRSED